MPESELEKYTIKSRDRFLQKIVGKEYQVIPITENLQAMTESSKGLSPTGIIFQSRAVAETEAYRLWQQSASPIVVALIGLLHKK
jgi:hypothetical protein